MEAWEKKVDRGSGREEVKEVNIKLYMLSLWLIKMLVFPKINIVYVSRQPNKNTNTKTNGQRNILRLKLTK